MANIDVKYEVWKNKLLDLGKRNRLLNYKDTARSNVKIEYPECGTLYNMIVKEENALVFPFEYDEENSEIEYVSNVEIIPVPRNSNYTKEEGSTTVSTEEITSYIYNKTETITN